MNTVTPLIDPAAEVWLRLLVAVAVLAVFAVIGFTLHAIRSASTRRQHAVAAVAAAVSFAVFLVMLFAHNLVFTHKQAAMDEMAEAAIVEAERVYDIDLTAKQAIDLGLATADRPDAAPAVLGETFAKTGHVYANVQAIWTGTETILAIDGGELPRVP